jgi:hypothetical protein
MGTADSRRWYQRGLITVFLAGVVLPASAQDIDRIQVLTQEEFRLLSEDLAGALSYRPLVPTTPLGTTGFDIGIGLTLAKMANTEVLERATSGDAPSTIPVPTLRAYKGLPLGFDIGLLYAQVPDSNIRYYGGELRYALFSGGVATPAVGVRGNFTKVSGIEQMEFSTRGVDLSVSKGFVVATPYAGVGYVWAKSDPRGNGGLAAEDVGMAKVFFGIGFNFVLTNFLVEVDRTGQVSALSAKAGLRF